MLVLKQWFVNGSKVKGCLRQVCDDSGMPFALG